jgi:ABC-type spermidine/putrescine transport system permease subunit II
VTTETLSVEGDAVPAAVQPSVRKRRPPRDVAGWFLRGWSILVYVFLYLPILFVVIYSFNENRRLVPWHGYSSEWFDEALQDDTIRAAIGVSVRAALLTSLVSVVIGSLAGIALARRGGGWVKPFLALVFLILVTPEIVDGIAYLIWFVRLNLDSSMARLVVGHSVFNSAVVALIVRARLQGLDESLEEAAADLGAPPTRVFRQITLPLMMPAVLAGALLSFTFSLDDVIISSFVTTAGSFTLPVYVFSSVRTGLKTELAAVSTLMLCLTLFALAVTAFVLRRSGESAEDITATITGT